MTARRARLLAVMGLVAVALAMGAARARAEAPFEGALTLGGLFGDGAAGGDMMVDLGIPVGAFRVGAALGAAALSSDDPELSRTFMPAALSVALRVGDAFGFELRGRGGLWGGGVSDRLEVGGFGSGGAFLFLRMSERTRFTLGAEAWVLLGDRLVPLVAPGLGFVWKLGGEEAP